MAVRIEEIALVAHPAAVGVQAIALGIDTVPLGVEEMTGAVEIAAGAVDAAPLLVDIDRLPGFGHRLPGGIVEDIDHLAAEDRVAVGIHLELRRPLGVENGVPGAVEGEEETGGVDQMPVGVKDIPGGIGAGRQAQGSELDTGAGGGAGKLQLVRRLHIAVDEQAAAGGEGHIVATAGAADGAIDLEIGIRGDAKGRRDAAGGHDHPGKIVDQDAKGGAAAAHRHRHRAGGLDHAGRAQRIATRGRVSIHDIEIRGRGRAADAHLLAGGDGHGAGGGDLSQEIKIIGVDQQRASRVNRGQGGGPADEDSGGVRTLHGQAAGGDERRAQGIGLPGGENGVIGVGGGGGAEDDPATGADLEMFAAKGDCLGGVGDVVKGLHLAGPGFAAHGQLPGGRQQHRAKGLDAAADVQGGGGVDRHFIIARQPVGGIGRSRGAGGGVLDHPGKVDGRRRERDTAVTLHPAVGLGDGERTVVGNEAHRAGHARQFIAHRTDGAVHRDLVEAVDDHLVIAPHPGGGGQAQAGGGGVHGGGGGAGGGDPGGEDHAVGGADDAVDLQGGVGMEDDITPGAAGHGVTGHEIALEHGVGAHVEADGAVHGLDETGPVEIQALGAAVHGDHAVGPHRAGDQQPAGRIGGGETDRGTGGRGVDMIGAARVAAAAVADRVQAQEIFMAAAGENGEPVIADKEELALLELHPDHGIGIAAAGDDIVGEIEITGIGEGHAIGVIGGRVHGVLDILGQVGHPAAGAVVVGAGGRNEDGAGDLAGPHVDPELEGDILVKDAVGAGALGHDGLVGQGGEAQGLLVA